MQKEMKIMKKKIITHPNKILKREMKQKKEKKVLQQKKIKIRITKIIKSNNQK